MLCHHHHKAHGMHGLLFILCLIGAFILGRKSEQYGFAIVRGWDCECDDSKTDSGGSKNFSEESNYS